ncbi:hypothetical protein Sango_2850700 [Sesamum angolense]|uniref:Uncharacterized protein n=1 Tax=Sesamum angolense TaxID=2727404 RepID=A0AAE1T6S0_9LAMI|nr:hypothetical protein Sango_2850700 [Sesamum angolense]
MTSIIRMDLAMATGEKFSSKSTPDCLVYPYATSLALKVGPLMSKLGSSSWSPFQKGIDGACTSGGACGLIRCKGRTLPGLDMPRMLLKERGAFRNADTGGAWRSSAHAIRCWVKSRNKRNPCV